MNQLIIWKELSLFIGINQIAISKHQHPIIQLIAGVDGPYLWKDNHGCWIEKNVLLVAPNHSHECNANGRKVVIISIDNESLLGEFVKERHLKTEPIIDFSSTNRAFDFPKLVKLLANNQWHEIHQIIENIFGFKPSVPVSIKKDERIVKVLDHIKNNIDSDINTEVLMDVSCLSESRLLHLFKNQMGLPIRNYILWCRIKIAFNKIVEGNSLTKAAYQAGFSDQAHLTRNFVKTFGASPSSLLKNSKFVQVFFPD